MKESNKLYTTFYITRKSLTAVTKCTNSYSKDLITQPINNQVKGFLSDKSAKRIQRIAENWTYAVKEAKKRNKLFFNCQFCFLTLTLASNPPKNSDRTVKNKILNPFLTELKKLVGGALNYIWRIETHPSTKKVVKDVPHTYDATGRVHFHIILDRYIPRNQMIAIWNRIQDRLKLVENSGIANPMGVYISHIPSANHVAAYITKYICKDHELSRKIDGKQWGCSDNLTHMKIQLEIVELYCIKFRKYSVDNSAILRVEILENWITHFIDLEEDNSVFWKLLEADNVGLRQRLDNLAYDNYQMHLQISHKLYKFVK